MRCRRALFVIVRRARGQQVHEIMYTQHDTPARKPSQLSIIRLSARGHKRATRNSRTMRASCGCLCCAHPPLEQCAWAKRHLTPVPLSRRRGEHSNCIRTTPRRHAWLFCTPLRMERGTGVRLPCPLSRALTIFEKPWAGLSTGLIKENTCARLCPCPRTSPCIHGRHDASRSLERRAA